MKKKMKLLPNLGVAWNTWVVVWSVLDELDVLSDSSTLQKLEKKRLCCFPHGMAEDLSGCS